METDKEAHIDTWLEIIRWLRASLDANVILIPHVQEISPDNDDQVLGTALLRQLQYDPAVKLAGGALSANDFKALISRCDFLVAERMHAAIAGLSTAVPTLVVGYSVKARGILTDLLGEQMTQERALVSIQEFLHPGQGLTKVQDAWSARDGIRQQLEASLPQIRRRAGRAFDLIQRQVEPKALQNRALLGFAPSPLPHQIPVPR
jgi:colanic acid/amylovoran biosynthesis protein